MRIQTKKLGLAAYLHINGCAFEGYIGGVFQFQSKTKTLQEWDTEYMNSCCKKHDTALVELRKYLSKPKHNASTSLEVTAQ